MECWSSKQILQFDKRLNSNSALGLTVVNSNNGYPLRGKGLARFQQIDPQPYQLELAPFCRTLMITFLGASHTDFDSPADTNIIMHSHQGLCVLESVER